MTPQTYYGFSKWFYLGLLAVAIGMVCIFFANNKNKSKLMENGYFVFILGLVGIISEYVDFATVLFVFVLISGFVLLINKIFIRANSTNINTKHYIYYAREFFPLVLLVWILRAFLFEVYQIPSSSMRPDLTVGDFVLVNKFIYGIREPFTNKAIIPIGKINRGDVIVFKDQQVKNRDLIKRVVGTSGDVITYKQKRLTINGIHLNYIPNGQYAYSDTYPAPVGKIDFKNDKYIEDLLGVKHSIITWDEVPSLNVNAVYDFKNKSNCNYVSNDEFSCTVPNGFYFMMGDNRDNSEDSRYWGFVPNDAVLGHAIYVVANLYDIHRFLIKIH